MGVKAVDFRVDRTLGPRLISSNRDPDLAVLLRSKVTEGPLAPARVSAPPTWDGVCFHKVAARKTVIEVPIPGRYVWDGQQWQWREEVDMDTEGNLRPGMRPDEDWRAYDARMLAESAAESMDLNDYKAKVARETGEAFTPRLPGDGSPSIEPPD